MTILPPRNNRERQALWDAATATDGSCTEPERRQMMAALHHSDMLYILGYLPDTYLPPDDITMPPPSRPEVTP